MVDMLVACTGWDLTGRHGRRRQRAMTAVPVPADTPADADALRDDIATNVIRRSTTISPDVQAKVNGILAALRGVGIVAS